jgi:hypothetical protein
MKRFQTPLFCFERLGAESDNSGNSKVHSGHPEGGKQPILWRNAEFFVGHDAPRLGITIPDDLSQIENIIAVR